jgi:signal peptide peptidase SppA
MGDDTANADFPDQEQRAAVCHRQWREAHGEQAADGTTAACWSNHLGIWAIEPLWFQQQVALFQAGHLPLWAAHQTLEARERRTYTMEEHTALIPIAGPMTKGDSKFGGTSTVRTRHALRQAARDPEVSSIVLQVYSPGGHVDGVQDLADDVWRVRHTKPVVAHIEDLGASAAYWVASQAGRISANATAEIGSIGTMAVLEDSSKRLERLGITVHVVSTGPYKGLGVDGAPVSQEALGYVRARVEAINQHFLASLQRGRGLTGEALAVISDGRVHHAAPARRLGLLDAVQSLDQTLEELRQGRGVAAPLRGPGAAAGHHAARAKLALRAQQRRHYDLTHPRRESTR